MEELCDNCIWSHYLETARGRKIDCYNEGYNVCHKHSKFTPRFIDPQTIADKETPTSA